MFGFAAGASLVLGWACILLIPTMPRLGMSESVAHRVPFAGFLGGIALGIAAAKRPRVKEFVTYCAAPFLLGGVGWFLGLLLGVPLQIFGLSEEHADVVPPGGFVVGALLGLLPLYAWLRDRVTGASGV
jgi:hypothetical protein